MYFGKEPYNPGKLRKVFAIYKTSKLVLSKNSMPLKTKNSEKLPY